MTSLVAKFVGKKILGETVANKFGTEDPYFEQVPATRLDGTPSGKFKKQRKALPPGISDHDGKVLTKVKRRAYRLDMCLFNCCGIRFGWSSVIGIVPAIGDVFDALLAMMVVRTCSKVEGGLPSAVRARMMINVLIDFGIGLVPFLGDIADAAFRANTRNAAILEEYLREKGKKTLRQSGMPIPAIDPSDPHEFDRLQTESPPEPASQQPSRHERMTTGTTGGTNGNGHSTPRAPADAHVRQGERSGSGFMGLFRSGSRARPQDVELGHGSGPATVQMQQRS